MLKINGKDYDVKFNMQFANRLIEDYAVKNNDGQITLDGFSHLINDLVDCQPEAITNAYRYALDVPAKQLPSLNDVAQGLEEAGIFKNPDIFSDLFKELKDNGFLMLKLKAYLKSRQNIVDVSKKVLSGLTDKGQKESAMLDLKSAEAGLAQIKKELKQLEK